MMNIEIFIEDTIYDPIPSRPVSSHLIVWARSPLYVWTCYFVIPKGDSHIFEFHLSTSVWAPDEGETLPSAAGQRSAQRISAWKNSRYLRWKFKCCTWHSNIYLPGRILSSVANLTS